MLGGPGHAIVKAIITRVGMNLRTRVNRCAIMEGHLITKKIVAIALRGFQANVAKKVSLTYKIICTKDSVLVS